MDGISYEISEIRSEMDEINAEKVRQVPRKLISVLQYARSDLKWISSKMTHRQ